MSFINSPKSASTDFDDDSRFPASQFISADDVTKIETKIIEGYLRKKSPKGLPGFKAWQQRYFVLTPSKLKYFHDPSCAKTLGAVPISMIATVDIAKLDRECRFDLVLHGEQSRKFQLRANNKTIASKWHIALSETIALADESKDMRKFSVKYWKEEDKTKQEGPSPVERALEHLKQDSEIKEMAGISKDKPELFVLTTSLLHGLSPALKECTLWRKIILLVTETSGLKCADGTKIQARAELRDTPSTNLPKFVVATTVADCSGGVAKFEAKLEITLPGMLDVNVAEMRVKLQDESDKALVTFSIPLRELLLASKPKFFAENEVKLGLGTTMTRETDKPPRTEDFNSEIKYDYGKRAGPGILEFPPECPDLKDGQFKFYAPKIFTRICAHFGIQASEFYRSICGDTFVEFVSNSKSGAFFFFSKDGRYMIKTIEQGECKCLRQMLPKYYEHCTKDKATLLCRFYGLFRLRCNKKTHYFIIMESVFHTNKYIHLILDLKGSTTNRHASEKDLKARPTKHFTGTILKDNDIRNSDLCVDVGKETAKRLRTALSSDVKFLSSQGIIDYSLLVGIHYPDMPDPRKKPPTKTSNAAGAERSLAETDEPEKQIVGKAEAFNGVGSRREIYFIGIIDILIQFGIFKGGEYIFKAKLKGEGEKISGQ
uniref:PIPK domain-containing protein n=1 Tax=Lotharella globosa TaxID=91324 RepID=A0A7S3YIB5_9EUKA